MRFHFSGKKTKNEIYGTKKLFLLLAIKMGIEDFINITNGVKFKTKQKLPIHKKKKKLI